MTKDAITITLPLPHKCLSPNARPHWAQKSKHTKAYRERAMLEAVAAKGRNFGERWTRATAHLHFYWPDKRRRDVRNAEGSMKAAYDGIVDAGVIVDDDANTLRHKPTDFDYDKENPRVVITVAAEKEQARV